MNEQRLSNLWDELRRLRTIEEKARGLAGVIAGKTRRNFARNLPADFCAPCNTCRGHAEELLSLIASPPAKPSVAQPTIASMMAGQEQAKEKP